MSNAKLFLPFRDEDGNVQLEVFWATRFTKGFRIDNIPFFTENFSFHDFVAVKGHKQNPSFELRHSGNSTIQMNFDHIHDLNFARRAFKKLGCPTEKYRNEFLAVNIPPNVSYKEINERLTHGWSMDRWEFKEACLPNNHCMKTKDFEIPETMTKIIGVAIGENVFGFGLSNIELQDTIRNDIPAGEFEDKCRGMLKRKLITPHRIPRKQLVTK